MFDHWKLSVRFPKLFWSNPELNNANKLLFFDSHTVFIFFELTMFSWFTCHFNTLFHLVIAGTTSVFGTMQSSVSSQTNVKTGKTTRPLSFYAFKEKVTVVFRTKKNTASFAALISVCFPEIIIWC